MRRADWVAVAVEDTWRIDDEWWHDEISRLYYQLELADGTTITVFEDLMKGGWYAQCYHPPAATSEG